MATEAAQGEAIAQRLQAKETALRNVTKKWLSFSNAIENSSLDECEALHKALLFDLAQYEFSVGKVSALVDTNVRQVAEYDRTQQSVEAEMTTTKADIERLTKVLDQERTIRNQKEQYSALARRIHQYPSRDETQAEITRLEAEIGQLETESGAVASALELRSKRFAGFMHALHDMQCLLEAEQSAEATPMETS